MHRQAIVKAVLNLNSLTGNTIQIDKKVFACVIVQLGDNTSRKGILQNQK